MVQFTLNNTVITLKILCITTIKPWYFFVRTPRGKYNVRTAHTGSSADTVCAPPAAPLVACLAAAMAPSEIRVDWETSQIIKYLLEDEDDITCRSSGFDDSVECDGPG